jgi:hypothetical protein
MCLHPIIRVSLIDARGLLLNTCTVNEPTRTKNMGLRIDALFYPYTFYTRSNAYKRRGLLIDVLFYPYTFYRHSATYKKQGASDRCPVLLVYFLYAQCCRLPIDDHCTFHTQQSSAYEKQDASIYIYPSSRYSIKSFQY